MPTKIFYIIIGQVINVQNFNKENDFENNLWCVGYWKK